MRVTIAGMHNARPHLPLRHPSDPTVCGPAARLDEDGTLSDDIDIAFSTHLTVVVPVRVEFACGRAPREVDLVIARTQCRDRRPRLQALLDAMPSALCRGAARRVAGSQPRALWARIAGHWQALCVWPVDGLSAPAAHGLAAAHPAQPC